MLQIVVLWGIVSGLFVALCFVAVEVGKLKAGLQSLNRRFKVVANVGYGEFGSKAEGLQFPGAEFVTEEVDEHPFVPMSVGPLKMSVEGSRRWDAFLEAHAGDEGPFYADTDKFLLENPDARVEGDRLIVGARKP